MKWRLAVMLLALAACRGPTEEPQHPVPEPVVEPEPQGPVAAQQLAPAVGVATPRSNPDGFYPLSLRAALTVALTKDVPTAIELPVPDSAQAVWCAVGASSQVTVLRGESRLVVPAGPHLSLVELPLSHKHVELVVEGGDTTLTINPVGYFEQSGAGLTVEAEPATAGVLEAGENTLTLMTPPSDVPDDTAARWLTLTATAADSDVGVLLSACGGAPLSALSVPSHETRTVSLLAPRGDVCATASSPLQVTTQVTARFRRFTRTAYQSVAPVVVLDTQAGVGWSGLPLAAQKLEVSFANVAGLEAATHAVLSYSASGASPADRVTIGPCASSVQPVAASAAPALLVHALEQPLCVEGSSAFHLRIELVGLWAPGDAEPRTCAPRPLAPPCSGTSVLAKLNCIPGVTATMGSGGTYNLQIVQPEDHGRPDGPTFRQRVRLTYRGGDAPVVLHTTGYELFEIEHELGPRLQANELEVEHRFFGTSKTASPDFTKLDIVQSAFDSHRIVELLRPLLTGPWLSSGYSKGGMTAVFHRRFFPCDVEGTVPFVAPISYGLQDPRYGPALQQLGGAPLEACHQVFRDIDHGTIVNKQQLAAQMPGSYTRIGGKDIALWLMTGVSSWSFFQFDDPFDPTMGCPAYVQAAGNSNSMWQMVQGQAQAGAAYSDDNLALGGEGALMPYVYQTANELGSPGASRAHLADVGPVPLLPPAELLLLGSVPAPTFEPRAMPDVQAWLERHGSRFLFIYGELDPWSAGAFNLGQATSSRKFVAPLANHAAGIDDLAQGDRNVADQLLRQWVGQGASTALPSLPNGAQYRDVMRNYPL